MEQIEKIKELLSSIEEDFKKVNDGNNSAGTRVRSQCQQIKKLCAEIRNSVQEIRASKKD